MTATIVRNHAPALFLACVLLAIFMTVGVVRYPQDLKASSFQDTDNSKPRLRNVKLELGELLSQHAREWTKIEVKAALVEGRYVRKLLLDQGDVGSKDEVIYAICEVHIKEDLSGPIFSSQIRL